MQRLARSLALGLTLAGVAKAQEEEAEMEQAEYPEDEQTGELPRMSEAQLSGLFKKLDKDADGKVTQADLLAFNSQMRKQRDLKFFEEYWAELDRDADGKVTLEEATHEQDADGGAPSDGLGQGGVPSDGQEYTTVMFKAADKDGDGSLNKAEALGFSSMEHEPVVEAAVAKYSMKTNDKDGDGKLSLEEFKKLFFGEPEPDDIVDMEAEEEKRAKEAFAHMDKNADGLLDVVEMQEWESGRHFEEHGLTQLAKHADLDGDGFIDLQELIATNNMEEVQEYAYHLESWANELEL